MATSRLTTRIDPALRADPDLGPLAVRAAGLLDEQAFDTVTPATAEWRLGGDATRKTIRVKVSDEKHTFEDEFTAEDLAPFDLRFRMIGVWKGMLLLRVGDMHRRFLDEVLLSEAAVG